MKLNKLLPAVALVLASNSAYAAYQLNVSIALSPQDPIAQAMESAKEAIEERSE